MMLRTFLWTRDAQRIYPALFGGTWSTLPVSPGMHYHLCHSLSCWSSIERDRAQDCKESWVVLLPPWNIINCGGYESTAAHYTLHPPEYSPRTVLNHIFAMPRTPLPPLHCSPRLDSLLYLPLQLCGHVYCPFPPHADTGWRESASETRALTAPVDWGRRLFCCWGLR